MEKWEKKKSVFSKIDVVWKFMILSDFSRILNILDLHGFVYI